MTTLHIRICFILSAFIINFCSPKLYADLDNQEVHAQSDEEAFLIRRIAEFWKDSLCKRNNFGNHSKPLEI